MKAPCDALVQSDWAGRFACSKSATQERLGHGVCGTHARQYDRWAAQNRGPSMAKYWWEWKEITATREWCR